MTESVTDKLILAGVKLAIMILVLLLGVGGEWILHKIRKGKPEFQPHYQKKTLFRLGKQSEQNLLMLFGMRNFMVAALWLCAIGILLINVFGERDLRVFLEGLGIAGMAFFVSFTMTYLVRFLANAGYYFTEDTLYAVRFKVRGYAYKEIARAAQWEPIVLKRGRLRIPLPGGKTLAIPKTDNPNHPQRIQKTPRVFSGSTRSVFPGCLTCECSEKGYKRSQNLTGRGRTLFPQSNAPGSDPLGKRLARVLRLKMLSCCCMETWDLRIAGRGHLMPSGFAKTVSSTARPLKINKKTAWKNRRP